MSARSGLAAFRLLFREFFAQFFRTESSVSDHQLRQAMIGVAAFLISPGILIPFQLDWTFEFAAIRFPAMLDPLTKLLATIFLTYSMVVIGVIAAFEWDALTFDRRDAMVLGPLPVAPGMVIAAKLAALGTLLLVGAAGINILTAFPFSMVAGAHQPMAVVARLFAAQVVSTMSASTFIFCALVSARALISVLGRGRIAVGTLLQIALISGLLCFIIFMPTSLRVEFVHVRHGPVRPVGVQMMPVPPWSPTNWFVALYDWLRGAGQPGLAHKALVAPAVTLVALASAVVLMMLGYRHQLRLALAPASSSGAVAGARLPRRIARLMAGRDAGARAAADFIVATLARSRAQQAPIAINAAIAIVMIALDLSRARGDVAEALHAASLASPIPLLLAYWISVGMRASFFVPSELPSAWVFRVSPRAFSASHAAIRGAMSSLVAPFSAVLAFGMSVRAGVTAAAWHAVVVCLACIVLTELVALSVPFIPFTQPYRPGHAKLKTRWPLYLIGAYVFSYALVRIERACWSGAASFASLLIALVALAVVLDFAGRLRTRRPSSEPIEELAYYDGRIAVLDLGSVVQRAPVES